MVEPRDALGARAASFELARGAAWLVGLAAALAVVDVLLASSPIGAAVAGAVLVDLGASRFGVRVWPGGEGAPFADKLRLVGRGVAIGAAPALLAGVALATLGGASLRAGVPSVGVALALVRTVALAVRAELLFRGLVLEAAARAGVPRAAAVVFGALAGAASMALAPGATLASAALVAATGALFGVVCARQGGVAAAVSAHASLAFLVGPGVRGALVSFVSPQGVLGLGAHARGPAAVALAASSLAVAAVVAGRPSRPIPVASPEP